MDPGRTDRCHRRLLEALEIPPALLLCARRQLDEGTRESGSEARDSGGSDARPDHPELGVFPKQGFGRFVEARFDHDFLMTFGEVNTLYDAHLDGEGPDLGLLGLDPGCGIEHDRNRRALGADAVDHHSGAQHGSDDRHPPDRGDPARPGAVDLRLSHLCCLRRGPR